MVSPSGVFLFKAGMVAPGPCHSHSSSLPPGTRVSALLLRPPEAFPGGVSAPRPWRPPLLALGAAVERWGQLVLGRGGCLVPREGAAASPVLLRWTDAPSLQLGRPRVPPDAARCFRRRGGGGGQGRPLPLPTMSPEPRSPFCFLHNCLQASSLSDLVSSLDAQQLLILT